MDARQDATVSGSQAELVEQQFGPRAGAYLSSAVHAQGADLQALAALVAARPGCTVLDIGCGGGHVSYAAAQAGGTVMACDLSAEMLQTVAAEAERRGLSIATRQGVAEALPFEPATFDVVLSRFSAHHWRDFAAGVREAARVLRDGGTAGFADVISPGPGALDTYLQTVEVLRDLSHVRDRSVAEWQEEAASAGLRPVSITTGRLRMEFPTWIARMRTPPELAGAIRAMQTGMSAEVRRYFEIEQDGSFMLDTAVLVFTRI